MISVEASAAVAWLVSAAKLWFSSLKNIVSPSAPSSPVSPFFDFVQVKVFSISVPSNIVINNTTLPLSTFVGIELAVKPVPVLLIVAPILGVCDFKV